MSLDSHQIPNSLCCRIALSFTDERDAPFERTAFWGGARGRENLSAASSLWLIFQNSPRRVVGAAEAALFQSIDLFKGSSRLERIFVAQDAVEGGAADAELVSGAQLVAAVQVQDVLDVMLND